MPNNHQLNCTISCRHDDDEFEKLSSAKFKFELTKEEKLGLSMSRKTIGVKIRIRTTQVIESYEQYVTIKTKWTIAVVILSMI